MKLTGIFVLGIFLSVSTLCISPWKLSELCKSPNPLMFWPYFHNLPWAYSVLCLPSHSKLLTRSKWAASKTELTTWVLFLHSLFYQGFYAIKPLPHLTATGILSSLFLLYSHICSSLSPHLPTKISSAPLLTIFATFKQLFYPLNHTVVSAQGGEMPLYPH